MCENTENEFHERVFFAVPLQLVVCFCSVVHRTVYTSPRSCLSARTIHNLVCIASSSRLCRPHKNKIIAMSSMFAPAHFSCSHSTPQHSHLLPRSLHQEQPVKSRCRSTNTALLGHTRTLVLWLNLPPPQVVSPTWSTTSTTQRLLKSFAKRSPAFRCPRTCVTRSSVTRPSAKRYLHHCSLVREKNQRALDKLITLKEKVCCPCLSVM